MEQMWLCVSSRLDQLCWHNFRIIGTDSSGISIEHNSRIIGLGYIFEGVVRVWFNPYQNLKYPHTQKIFPLKLIRQISGKGKLINSLNACKKGSTSAIVCCIQDSFFSVLSNYFSDRQVFERLPLLWSVPFKMFIYNCFIIDSSLA